MTIFDNPRDIKAYRAITLASALRLYKNTGMKVNSAYTPKNMMALASELTGETFKPRQYEQAAQALDKLVAQLKAEKDAEAQTNAKS